MVHGTIDYKYYTIINDGTYNSLHNDLQQPSVTNLTKIYYKKFHVKFQTNPNPLIKNMLSLTFPSNVLCRLNQKLSCDLL